jgi:hypothetical protein
LRGMKPRELPACAYAPVIRLAEVSPFRATPEFLLRRQECDHIIVLVDEIGRDPGTVLRPAAMLPRLRSVVWVTLYQLGLVVREHGVGTQEVCSGHYDDGRLRLHLALPPLDRGVYRWTEGLDHLGVRPPPSLSCLYERRLGWFGMWLLSLVERLA